MTQFVLPVCGSAAVALRETCTRKKAPRLGAPIQEPRWSSTAGLFVIVNSNAGLLGGHVRDRELNVSRASARFNEDLGFQQTA